MGSSNSKTKSSTKSKRKSASRKVATSRRQHEMQLREQMKKLADDSDVDFYELFGLPRYCDVTKQRYSRKLRTKYFELAMVHHPDRGGDEVKMQKLVYAYNVLRNADLKRLYDEELHRKYDTARRPGGWKWWCRWVTSTAMTVAGAGLIIGGVVATPFSGGASLGLSVGGYALLSGGVNGMVSQCRDPDKSDADFIKGTAIATIGGAVCGAAGGLIVGAVAGAAVSGAAVTGAAVAVDVATTAAVVGGGFAVDHVVDHAIAEGHCAFADGRTDRVGTMKVG